MNNYFNNFAFIVYPYICLAVFLMGSLARFDRDQYTWKSDSSQMLRTGTLIIEATGFDSFLATSAACASSWAWAGAAGARANIASKSIHP